MRSAPELVAYLNDFFAPEVWRATYDLLGNISLSEAISNASQAPLVNGMSNGGFEFAVPPSIRLMEDETIAIRIPGQGQHHITGDLDVSDPLPNATLEVGITIETTAGAAAAEPE